MIAGHQRFRCTVSYAPTFSHGSGRPSTHAASPSSLPCCRPTALISRWSRPIRPPSRIEVRLEVADATCAECVLPGPLLEQVIADTISRHSPGEFELVLRDPRTAAQVVTERPADYPRRASGFHRSSPARLAGALRTYLDRPIAGLRVGLRHEGSWRSWMLIVDEWEKFLRRDGAEPVVLEAGGRVGEEGEQTRADVQAWARRDRLRHIGSRHLRVMHVQQRSRCCHAGIHR